MGIEIKGNNNGIAVEGSVTIGELNLGFGKGITSAKCVEMREVEDAEEEQRELPYELSTPKAMVYWKKLRDGGWVDDHWQRTNQMSLSAAGFTVHCFAQVLNLDGGWAMFEKFWGCKNLQQEYNKIQYKHPQKCERLKIIFDL